MSYDPTSIFRPIGQNGDASEPENPSALPAGVAADRAWPSPMPRDAWHGPLADLVCAIEPHSEADPAALLVSALAYFGVLAGRIGYFTVESTNHYANLFAAIVGDTSKGRKGTTDGQIRRAFADLAPDLASRIGEGLSSGEGLIWAVRDPILKREPVKERGRIVDYQDVQVDAGIDDKRLLVVEGEFGGALTVLSREGNTLSAVIRRAWDGGGVLKTMTKNSPAQATDAHIGIIAHITHRELREKLTACDSFNGFANRFLWCCARRSKSLPEGGGDVANYTTESRAALAGALAWARESDRLIARDNEARALWANVYADLSAGGDGLAGAATSRAEAQVMRLAMIYALADCSPWIRLPHLKAALAVWRYCEASASVLFAGSTGGRDAKDLKLIGRFNSGRITAREFQQASHCPTAEAAENRLRELAASGYGTFQYEGRRGIPTFRIDPRYATDSPNFPENQGKCNVAAGANGSERGGE